MLDIMIFYMDKPIYEGAKKVGEIPHLWLGSYTPLTQDEVRQLDSATQDLSPQAVEVFKAMISQIGKRFWASNLLIVQQRTDSPKTKKEIFKELQLLYPAEHLTLRNMQKEKDCLKAMLARSFSPEEQLKMMMQLKTEHDRQKATKKISDREDEIFSRGIAECVQTLKDLPWDQKSPLMRHLSFSSTHRQQDVMNYSR